MIATHTMGRSANLFAKPEEFRPERFLPGATDPVFTDAWRPFERGPRNCIGQGLALLEMKIVMVLTLREFHVKSAFAKQQCGASKPMDTMKGDPAYQVQGIAAKPKDGLPAKVTARDLSVNR